MSLAVIVCLAGAVCVVPVATATAPPTLSSDDADLTPGQTDRIAIELSSAPEDVSGFNLTVAIADATTATVVDGSAGDDFGMSEVTVAPDGSRVTLVGVDLDGTVEAGDEAIPLASLEFEGVEPGDTSVGFAAVDLEDADGDAIEPSLAGGVVTVSDPDASTTAGSGGDSGGDGDSSGAADSDSGAGSADETTSSGESAAETTSSQSPDDATTDGDVSGDDEAGTGGSGDRTSDPAEPTADGSDAGTTAADADGSDAGGSSGDSSDGDDALAMPWSGLTVGVVLWVAVAAGRSD